MNWISNELYATIQKTIPIACVDLLPICLSSSRIGLILRDSPHQGQVWCLVGGRVRLGEAMSDAMTRHFVHTLGKDAKLAPLSEEAAVFVEYLPTATGEMPHDPRQHSISVTWASGVSGDVVPQGEASDFKWFDIPAIPWPKVGFGQGSIIRRLLPRIGFVGRL